MKPDYHKKTCARCRCLLHIGNKVTGYYSTCSLTKCVTTPAAEACEKFKKVVKRQ